VRPAERTTTYMSARLSRASEARPSVLVTLFSEAGREAPRYLIASAVALVVDAGVYVTFIRMFGVNYLVAAPVGYAVGILVIYLLSTRWVFGNRRLTDARFEFLIFVFIGGIGLLVNQLVIFICVERLTTSYELAKLASAAIVFGFNFGIRKLALFTRF